MCGEAIGETPRDARHSTVLPSTARPHYMAFGAPTSCSDGRSVFLGRNTWPRPYLQMPLLFSPHLITCKRCTVYNSYWSILGYLHDWNWRSSEDHPLP